jgi:hypothetical protein
MRFTERIEGGSNTSSTSPLSPVSLVSATLLIIRYLLSLNVVATTSSVFILI